MLKASYHSCTRAGRSSAVRGCSWNMVFIGEEELAWEELGLRTGPPQLYIKPVLPVLPSSK